MSRFNIIFISLALVPLSTVSADTALPTSGEVLQGLREFYRATAKSDGSYQAGVDPNYLGMSDCAYSDMAAVTYACLLYTSPSPRDQRGSRMPSSA